MAETRNFQCADGKVENVDIKDVQDSKLIKGLLEEDDDPESDIPVAQVKKDVFEKILTFTRKVNEIKPAEAPADWTPFEIEKPLSHNDMKQVINCTSGQHAEWFAQYVDDELDPLCTLVMAANYWDIKPLLELVAAKIASFIKGKSVEEVREIMGIENDITPEEMALIK